MAEILRPRGEGACAVFIIVELEEANPVDQQPGIARRLGIDHAV